MDSTLDQVVAHIEPACAKTAGSARRRLHGREGLGSLYATAVT